jgi:hypothetical protein
VINLKRMLVLDTERISAHNEVNKTSVRLEKTLRGQMPTGNTSLHTVILPGLAESGAWHDDAAGPGS